MIWVPVHVHQSLLRRLPITIHGHGLQGRCKSGKINSASSSGFPLGDFNISHFARNKSHAAGGSGGLLRLGIPSGELPFIGLSTKRGCTTLRSSNKLQSGDMATVHRPELFGTLSKGPRASWAYPAGSSRELVQAARSIMLKPIRLVSRMPGSTPKNQSVPNKKSRL